MSETILMAVNQELVDAMAEVLKDSQAYRIEGGQKPGGSTVQEWIDRAERQLAKVEKNHQFFAPSAIRYKDDGDC